MKRSKYVIGGTDYSRDMNDKTAMYNSLIVQAERINFGNDGKPTLEEGELYLKASKVCEQIRNMNLSQRSVYEKWQMRYESCQSRAQEIIDLLKPRPAQPLSRPGAVPNPPEVDDVMHSTVPTAAPRKAVPQSAPQPVPAQVGTDSGFSTANACRDVPAETIASWYKEAPKNRFGDLVGMDTLKERLLLEAGDLDYPETDRALGIPASQRYLFYGPAGTGKSAIIEAFAGEMMDKGFHFLSLLGSEIHQSLVGVAEKTVQIAFQEAMDNAPCVIFIDEVENVCAERSGSKTEGHEKKLTVAFLEALNRVDASEKRVVFLSATNHPLLVDSAMLDRMNLVLIDLPDAEVRESFFHKKFAQFQLEGITLQDMARETEDYSFRDLNRLVGAIAATLKKQLISDFSVVDADGDVDKGQTDQLISDAVRNGNAIVSADLFHRCQQATPPSEKTSIRQEIQEFQRRVSAQQ